MKHRSTDCDDLERRAFETGGAIEFNGNSAFLILGDTVWRAKLPSVGGVR